MSFRDFSVGLIDLCSTNSATGVTAEGLRQIRCTTGASQESVKAPPSRRKWTRLTDEQRSEAIRRYESGDTTTQLAKDFGVAKSTIIGILRANSVVVRRQPLAPEQVSEAARLYESGLSLSQVAATLKVSQETMRMAIIAAGVELRPPTKAKA